MFVFFDLSVFVFILSKNKDKVKLIPIKSSRLSVLCANLGIDDANVLSFQLLLRFGRQLAVCDKDVDLPSFHGFCKGLSVKFRIIGCQYQKLRVIPHFLLDLRLPLMGFKGSQRWVHPLAADDRFVDKIVIQHIRRPFAHQGQTGGAQGSASDDNLDIPSISRNLNGDPDGICDQCHPALLLQMPCNKESRRAGVQHDSVPILYELRHLLGNPVFPFRIAALSDVDGEICAGSLVQNSPTVRPGDMSFRL